MTHKPLTQDDLTQFSGTENHYRHLCGLLYSDGAKYFAECAGGGAYWFLDIVATEYLPLQRREEFMVVKLIVTGTKAKIVVDDGNGNVLKTKDIDFTDCPAGEWKFYLSGGVLFLPSEY